MTKIAYLGPVGSFTHQAALKFFGEDAELVNTPAHLVPRKVKLGSKNDGTDFGILAVENIVHGFIESTFDALYCTADVQIIGEIYLPIQMNLITRATSAEKITHIFSHDAALSQCRKHIDELEKKYGIVFSRSPMPSTSAAVEMAGSNPQYAAIGSQAASIKYEIPILASDFHDHHQNSTRFWIFGMGKTPEPGNSNKTVFLVEIESRAGTLRTLLNLFADHNINITWIKPQIIPTQSQAKSWVYAFFIECEGHIDNEALKTIYSSIRTKKLSIMRGRGARMVGSFPSFPVESLTFASSGTRKKPRTP